jgi:hypothetical protein
MLVSYFILINLFYQPVGVAPFNFTIDVFADGPTKVFRIADPASAHPVPPPPNQAVPGSASKVNFVVRALVSSIGFSIIDSSPQVLLLFFLFVLFVLFILFILFSNSFNHRNWHISLLKALNYYLRPPHKSKSLTS